MGELEIVGRELLPHLLGWLGANFLNAFIAAILAESGLSILGLGPPSGHDDMWVGIRSVSYVYCCYCPFGTSYDLYAVETWWWRAENYHGETISNPIERAKRR